METSIGRRVFVGSVVAGLPLLASTARGAALGPQTTHVHATGGGADLVIDHIVRQMAAAHNGLRREPKGEHLRAFAAQLRTLAVYGRSIGVDSKQKSAITTLIQREGRDAVLYAEPDRAQIRAELKAIGAQPDERLLNAPRALDYKARNAALNAFLASDPTALWEELATALERVAPELDRRMTSVLRVSRQDDAFWEGYCYALWEYLKEVQWLGDAHCVVAVLPVIGVAIMPLCISYQLAALMLALVYGANCWNVL